MLSLHRNPHQPGPDVLTVADASGPVSRYAVRNRSTPGWMRCLLLLWIGLSMGALGVPARASEAVVQIRIVHRLSLIHISEPTRPVGISRMPSSA